MLIKCPECELQVSDKAFSCPHCGYPFQPSKIQQPRRKKRMRLPNGFGQITEIKNRNLRNRYRAMVTVAKTPEGKCVSRILKPQGYFPTYNAAYEALLEYHKNPYDLDNRMTVKDLYEKWSEEYFKNIKPASRRTITSAWAYCWQLYDMPARDIRARHIRGVIEHGSITVNDEIRKPSANIKSRIKSLFNLMYDYAVEYEIVDKNYSRTFDIGGNINKEKSKATRSHISFTDHEMLVLEDNAGKVPYADIVLIQCYMGWRPQELGLLRISNVDLDNWFITGGMKTEAGTDRVVPIHEKIREYVKNAYNEAVEIDSEYLFNCLDAKTHKTGTILTYDKYKVRFNKVVKELNLNPEHRPHDPRKQFVTMCKRNGVDEYAIKRMVGHSIADITESTYTDRDIDWLMTEIHKKGV